MGENKRKLVKKEDWLAVLFVVLGIFVRPDTFRSESNQPSLHE